MSWSGDGSQPVPIQGGISGPRRSRSGCALCRARKVKCDETWPVCMHCERLKLDCPGPPGLGSASRRKARRSSDRDTEFTQAGTLRQRVSKSCQPCRVAKARCSGGSTCSRCSKRGVKCAYISESKSNRRKSLCRSSTSGDVGLGISIEGSSEQYHRAAFTPEPGNTATSVSWLYAPDLPRGERLWTLVEEYFAHIHPLRCFGFVHKPSFLQRLDEDVEKFRDRESLLHAICAFGAKFLALNYTSQLSPDAILTAGNQWAKVAKARIFLDLDDLSMEKLMAAILLYDHDLRIGSYASAFMLSGITARMSQALQLNLEKSADVLCTKSETSPIDNEARRRSMWSCYVMDSWVGSGVNQLTLLEDRDLKLQLPCHSHNFLLGVPCITETLDEGKVLGFVSRDEIPPFPAQNMGIEAYFIRLVSSRKKVLRYVKQLDTSKPPWQSDSEFIQLTIEFDHWRNSLPQSLMWNPGAIYARKESSQLGALTLLWCTYHQTLVDLYRIGMPVLFRIQKNITFPPDQQGFLENCRRACFENAREVSSIISEALRHGIKVLADTWLCIIAHDSTKVMLHFLKLNWQSPQGLSQREVDATLALVQRNLEALLQMRAIVATAEHCYLSVIKMMAAAGIQPQMSYETAVNGRASHESEESPSAPGSPVQDSPEKVLNPLAIYRMARTALHEKDQISASNSPSTNNHNSPATARVRTRRTPRSLHQNQQHSNNSLPNHNGLPGMEHAYLAPNNAAGSISLSMNGMVPFTASGLDGPWEPANLAVMDILDGGIAPWTEEYLTDSQSGVDPFLFPF